MLRILAVSLLAALLYLVAFSFTAPSTANAQAESAPGAAGKEGSPATTASTDDQPAEDMKSAPQGSVDSESGMSEQDRNYALMVLGVGIVTVLGLIIVGKVNAFISLITAAIVVSLLAPGATEDKISRVAAAFGSSAGSIGIVIAMAAVIGKCMLDSGAADRVVNAFLHLLGEKRSPIALMGSGFVLAVPVFFDTVFYLLVPLARSLHRRTGKQYLKYIMAIAAGGAITHTLVPPTPGPLMMASNLGFDVGIMIMVGAIVAFPAAIVGLLFASLADRLMNVPMRPIAGQEEPEPLDDSQLPSLFLSLLPVILPVLMISTNTVLTTLADNEHAALLKPGDITNVAEFQRSVSSQAKASLTSPGGRVLAALAEGSSDSQPQRDAAIALLNSNEELNEQQESELIAALNAYVLPRKDLYEEEAFLGTRLNSTAKGLVGKDRVRMKKVVAERMNRALLESAYPKLVEEHTWETPKREAANVSALFGNANLALLISTIIALLVLVKQRGLKRHEMAAVVETSLMSGGVIILITAGGGAFGSMLKAAQVGDAIQSMFSISGGTSDAGMMFLVLGFVIAMVLKFAQGSSTVAMITGSAMLAGIAQPETLGFHPVYLATAIGAGSLIGSWMNDSGFWIFAKMGGLTETETLKSWSILLIMLGGTSFAMTLLLAKIMPLTSLAGG